MDTLSIPRANLTACSLGDKIYFAGGENANGPSNRVDIYDVVTDTWTIDSLSIARTNLSSASVGDLVLFAGGGNVTSSTVYKRVDIYNTLTNTWTIDSLTTARTMAAATSVGNKFMIGGGIPSAVGAPTNTVAIYTVTSTGLHPEFSNANAFEMMPNPANNNVSITINATSENSSIEVFNLMGEKVMDMSIEASVNLDLKNLTKGIYLVKLISKGATYTQKLMVE
jgi:Secretion system C-terminal sorting domain/Galactose oxidase, central domain/Kelch motif